MIDFCRHSERKKYGKDRKGRQRHRCLDCGKIVVDEKPLLGAMRIDENRAAMILEMLVEGSSVRAISRISGADPHTILDLLTLVGGRCQRFLDHELRGLIVGRVQVDEVWQFVGCKQKTADRRKYGPQVGDAWLWTALERDTKLFLCWRLGKRTGWDAEDFIAKLARATKGRFQLSSDAFASYKNAISRHLGGRVDFGQVVKTFSANEQGEARRYSPATIVNCKRRPVFGQPSESDICTSHVERSNLGLRTCLRRMTRLSLGFSKKWENHAAAVAFYMAHYNYVRAHGTLKTTPAVAHGIADRKWTLRQLLEATATQ